jgi:hypothetical protein
VEIARIQPKMPIKKTSIIAGNNFTISAGLEKVKKFIPTGTPHDHE